MNAKIAPRQKKVVLEKVCTPLGDVPLFISLSEWINNTFVQDKD